MLTHSNLLIGEADIRGHRRPLKKEETEKDPFEVKAQHLLPVAKRSNKILDKTLNTMITPPFLQP